MERNYRGKLWTIMATVAGIGVLALLCFATHSTAQLFGRKATPLSKFLEGIELNRKGEFEKAKTCFDFVFANIKTLTPPQQQDLRDWININNIALAGRLAFEQTLIKGETALKERRIEETKLCIKELLANPYGSPAQRERLRLLQCAVNDCPAPMDYKQLLKTAQAAFKKGDLDTAELFARDSIAQRPFFHAWTSDTPEKLIDQIREERERRLHPNVERKDGLFGPVKNLFFPKDPVPPNPPVNPNDKQLPKINDYPNDPLRPPGQPMPLPMPGTDPSQQAPMPPQYYPQPPSSQPLPAPPYSPQPSLPLPPLPLPPPPQSSNNQPSTTMAVRMSDQDLPPPGTGGLQQTAFNVPVAEDPLTAEKRRQALACMRDAENLLQLGDLEKAANKAKEAKDLRALRPSDPNPERVIQEVLRRQDAARVAAGGKPAETRTPPPRPQDAKVLVKQARDLIKKQQFDEAQRLIGLASEARPHGWGLFEDSPEKLQKDLNRLRTDRNKERANELMKQANKLFKEGHVADAKSLAQEALALHGPYGYFDKGDRPQHLLDEIYRIELREGKEQVSFKQDIKSEDRAGPIQSGTAPDDAKRKQAEALLFEARTLQLQGKLIEARARAIQARDLNVVFGVNELTPNGFLADLGAQCNQLLNKWCQDGLDQANRVSDQDRFAKALDILKRARDLCMNFEQDPQPIEARIGYIMQQQGQAPPPPPKFTAIQQEGLDMLNQARLEMKNGNLPVARKLIMEALEKKYDVEMQAMWVLKTLESDERQREIDNVNVNARSGIDAFRNKEYRKAAQILNNLNPNLLYPNVLSTVREILADPEMRPSNLAKEREGFASERGPDKAPTTQDPGKPPAGMASVGDMPRGTDVKTVRDLEKVQFDYWRNQSIAIQQTAIDVCKVNPAEAIVLLEGFLGKLNATSFDINDKAALIRPIEIRIDQYKRIQADVVWQRAQQEAARPGPQEITGREREEKRLETKYQTEVEVSKLMTEAADLMNKGKYEEALQKYRMSNQLLPKAQQPVIGIEQAKQLIIERDYKRQMQMNADFFQGQTLKYDFAGANPASFADPMRYPAGFDAKRRQDLSNGLPGLGKSPTERMIEARLMEPIAVNFRDTMLSEAIMSLHAQTGLNIVPDLKSLRDVGISLESRVTLQCVDGITLKSALELLLRQLGLTYVIQSEVIQITTESASKGNLVQRVYNITDLVVPIPDYPTSTFDSIHDAFRRHMNGSMGLATSQASPMTSNQSLPPGTPVSTGYPGTGGAIAGQPAGYQGGESSSPTGPVLADQLISLVQDMVEQQTWASCGGRGMIKRYPLGNALVVNQTEDVHAKIGNLLANLRKMQEVQVAIEMRVLTMSDQWYDLVNMNFEVGNTSAFAKGPGMIAGVAPAGTSPDMSIPFRSIVSAFGAPPFAGNNGVLLGSGSMAIGAGFSFLNEIQVHMFMEAARGDKRTQTLANPNVTVLNGATANIALNKYKFYNTGATPIQNGAQVFFMPQNNPFPVGINMQVTPIVSADRRFVRLHLVPNITNLVSSNPPTTVEVPIPQLGEVRDGGRGPASYMKMILQQPEFETVSLNTTVNVPDGGTVLLGGLKTMAEVRVETGPPVLRALPLVSRLFRNSNWTRESRNLMIMVTPHIIINEAEMNYQPEQSPVIPTAFRR